MEKKRPIVYVTRDIERALGMEPSAEYMIVSNNTPYGREVQEKYPEYVQLVSSDKSKDKSRALDTFDLLSLPSVATLILEKNAQVLVFQNNPRIERLAIDRGWKLLNPSADLSRRVEEKISQIEWLGKDAKFLPPHKITTVKEVESDDKNRKKFVLQFNHSHTGGGTYIIDSSDALNNLKKTFPDRPCRIVDFIDGPIYTMNVVAGFFTLYGSISYQITGLKPFTELPFSTVGNDWSLGNALSDYDKKNIKKIARTVSRKMKKDGWKGLFGIDFVKETKTGKIYLLEINARQPASTTYESQLSILSGIKPTIFNVHIATLTHSMKKPSLIFKLKNIKDGAQIIQRVIKRPLNVDVPKLTSMGMNVIKYDNDEHNTDLYRIQSSKGIMKSPNELNSDGQFIASCIKPILK